MPRVPANSTALTQSNLPVDAKLQIVLMKVIVDGIALRFASLQEAARAAEIDKQSLSRIRCGDHCRYSIATLLNIAMRLGIGLKIEVQLS